MNYDFVTPLDFVSYVAQRGFRAEPVLNDIEVARDGVAAKVVGYDLIGPRRNKKFVPMNAVGLLPLFDARLWCDGVDYGTEKTKIKTRNETRKKPTPDIDVVLSKF